MRAVKSGHSEFPYLPPMKTAIFYLALSAFLIISCKHKPSEDAVPAKTTTGGCDTANVTYSVTIKKVLGDNCLRCHGSTVYTTKGSGYNWDDYHALKAQADNGHLAKAINHLPGAVPMPLDQTDKMSDCDIRKMMIWIALARCPLSA